MTPPQPRHDGDVVRLASAQVAVTMDPGRGAKITSLLDLASNREWLLQPTTAVTPAAGPGYGSVFTHTPLAGWDEMFPTVDACQLADGSQLPDHGEVWSRPWRTTEASAASARCEIDGVALDYRFSRQLEVSGPDITARYRAQTTRAEGIPVLWAAHPQFAVRPGTMLELPHGISVLDSRPEGSADEFRPLPVGSNGLDWREVAGPGDGVMIYARPDDRVGHVRLVDPDGTWLAMTWDTRHVPYFALWIDNRCYAPEPVVCPEPMSGYYDSLRRAADGQRALWLAARSSAEWTMRLTVGRT
jgi:galactose mutarotase-like enzyme